MVAGDAQSGNELNGSKIGKDLKKSFSPWPVLGKVKKTFAPAFCHAPRCAKQSIPPGFDNDGVIVACAYLCHPAHEVMRKYTHGKPRSVGPEIS